MIYMSFMHPRWCKISSINSRIARGFFAIEMKPELSGKKGNQSQSIFAFFCFQVAAQALHPGTSENSS